MNEPTRQTDSGGERAAGDQPAQAAQGGEPAAGRPRPAGDSNGKRRVWAIAGVGLLVLLLAAAAYVGGRLLNRPPAGVADAKSGAQLKIMVGKGGPGGNRTFQIEPAKDLPQSNPDLRGVLVRRQDNSLFVGTGKVMRMVQKQGSQTQASPPTYDGPVLEAVITHDTQIFRDETNLAAPPDQSDKIQQIVKPGSLDDLTPNSVVQVWGDKTGERTIARILVFQPG